MSQPIVLIIFYCRNGETEKLALEAAVGAVQARGLIRLRRLPDLDGGAGAGGGAEEFARMRKEYVAPTEKDILNADVLLLVGSMESPLSAPEWQPFDLVLSGLRDAGRLADIGVSSLLPGASHPTGASEAVTTPSETGRTLVESVRSRKQNKEQS